MKKFLPYLLVLALTALGSHAVADDVTVLVAKHGDSAITLTPNGGKESPVTVPITYDSGASWDSVKDSYDIAPDTYSALEAKKVSVTVGSDGGLSFHKTK
jgi:hypothetical protein